MAEKMSMLIVVVDLDCHKCYHKIRKILCQLQDHERIRTISLDNKSKTITIVGPFDPLRLACKLRCKGGKVVRDVHIVDTTNGPPPENMPDGPPTPVKKGKNKKKNMDKPLPAERPPSPPPPEQAPPPSSPVHQPPPPDQGMSAMVPQQQYVEEKPPRAELEQPMDMPMPVPQHHPQPPMPACPGRPVAEYVIPTVEIPATMVGPCCAPCYQGYYDSCRCSCCGRVYGTTVRPLPPPCGAYRGCRTFSDDDPSAACSIM